MPARERPALPRASVRAPVGALGGARRGARARRAATRCRCHRPRDRRRVPPVPCRTCQAGPAQPPASRSRRGWDGDQAAEAPEWAGVDEPSPCGLVDGATRGQPQARYVSLSAVRPSPAGAQRTHADRSRRQHPPTPPRAHPLRACRSPAGPAADTRRVAPLPAAPAVVVATRVAAAAPVTAGITRRRCVRTRARRG